MQASGDGEGERNNDTIFDNVLPLKSGREEPLPGDGGEQDEGEYGGDHVGDEEGDRKALKTRDEKGHTNEHLVDAKEEYKFWECDKGERAREKRLDKRICGARMKKFESAKPKKDDKQRCSCDEDAVFLQDGDNMGVNA